MNCKKIIAIFVFCYLNCCIAKRSSLPSMVIDKNSVSVSGLSSGAYMAVQLHVAYSSTFKKGVGAIAGGPYYCAEGLMSIKRCMDGSASTIPVSRLVDTTRQWANDGRIDPVANLQSKVYIFTGTKDSVVLPSVSDKLYSYYTNFVKTENIVYKKDIPAEHSMVTDNYGNKCSYKGSPYINNCGFDTAGQLFENLYGRLHARNNHSSKLSGSLLEFDQTAFVSGHGMATTGWVYIPKNCAEGQTCKLHVALHGCKQNAITIGDAFYKNAGYNLWADTNNIIVLYPQTGIMATNGCWDWWGYDSPHFAQKSAPQMAAIKAMVDRIASGSSQSTTGKPTTGKPTTGKPTTGKPTTERTAKPTESPKTYTDNNYNHVVAGRAYTKLGNTYAKGSNDFMGLYNVFIKTTLKQTKPDYYHVV